MRTHAPTLPAHVPSQVQTRRSGRTAGPARLVLFAHGSSDVRWAQPMKSLVESVARSIGPSAVTLGFMQLAAPSLMDVARDAVRDRITRLAVLPVFLSNGAHVARDIPDQVDQVRARYPSLDVRLLPSVGSDPRVAALLHTIAVEAAAELEERSR